MINLTFINKLKRIECVSPKAHGMTTSSMKKATYFACAGDGLHCFKTAFSLACKDQSVLLLNCSETVQSKFFLFWWKTANDKAMEHVRQKHFRFYRLAVCPPSLAKTQQTTTIKRTNRSNLRKIRIERKALSSLHNCVSIYIHNRHNRSCRELLPVYADRCLANIFAPSQAIHDSCHWSITVMEFAKKILTYKALFPWFPILLKTLKRGNFLIPRA